MNASELMTTGAATVRPDTTLADAAQLMLQHQISGLPVVDAEGKLVGLISEADFLRPDLLKLLASDGSGAAELNSRRVEEMMTRDPVSIEVDTTLEDIAALMERHGVRRLPVLTQGKVVGIVSRANLVMKLLRRAQAEPPRGGGAKP